MMSKSATCCDSCFSMLAKRSVRLAKLWLELCDIQINTKIVFGLKTKDFPMLRLLETLGFIVTTDTPCHPDIIDIIVVKVIGKQEDELGIYFCGGKCNGK